MTTTNPLTKRVCLDIDLECWRVIERLAEVERREPRAHAAVLLERLAERADPHDQAA